LPGAAPFDAKGAAVDLLLPSFRTVSLVRNIRDSVIVPGFYASLLKFVILEGIPPRMPEGSV
jgi:hypothetical protein